MKDNFDKIYSVKKDLEKDGFKIQEGDNSLVLRLKGIIYLKVSRIGPLCKKTKSLLRKYSSKLYNMLN